VGGFHEWRHAAPLAAGWQRTVLHLRRLENDGRRRDHRSGVQKAGGPKALFTATVLGGGGDIGPFRYDVSHDGKKFLIDAAPTDGAATPPSTITIVLNWQTLVKK